MSKHTALPWMIHKVHLIGNETKEVANLYGGIGQLISIEEQKANAELIITAVNNFEELVERLQDAKLQIEYLQQKFIATGTGNAVLSQIEVTLAKLEIKR